MGATASINASSKKYKPSEPIEVKFHDVVKYDDGDEKTFKDRLQLEPKKQQPLSLLATAIKILEKKPKDHPPPNGHMPANYARQVRPRSAYVVLKKGSQSSSTHSTITQNGTSPNGLSPKTSHQKQLKTKQSLYMSLINPNKTVLRNPNFPRNAMTVPERLRPSPNAPLNYNQSKSYTLPRYCKNDGTRLRVNRRLYMDMIRPVMASPQYLKIGGSRSIPTTPSTQRTMSRQSNHQNFSPMPPNDGHVLRRQHPNSTTSPPGVHLAQQEVFTPQKGTGMFHGRSNPPQRNGSELNGSVHNGFLPHRGTHLPRLTRKKDLVSLNSSLTSRSRGEIPRGHPDNITPLYFRKSLAYSPQYSHKEMLSNPL